MRFSDFLLLSAVCFVWGLNLVVTKWVVTDAGVPPLFFAGIRFLGIALVLFWFLRPLPKNLGIRCRNDRRQSAAPAERQSGRPAVRPGE